MTTEDNRPAQTYVALTEIPFKTRFANTKSSFNNPNKRLSTELSKHVWCLEEARLKFKITWEVLKQTSLTTLSRTDVICVCGHGRSILSFVDLNWQLHVGMLTNFS